MRLLSAVFLASVMGLTSIAEVSAQNPKTTIDISTLPAQVLVSPGQFDQRLNFDLIVDNKTSSKVTITELEMSAYASNGALVLQRRISSNGDSIAMLGNRTMEAGARRVLFNPFHSVPPDVEIAKLHYRFTLEGDGGATSTAEATINPVTYKTKTDLTFPVTGRVLAWDGPDLYGHHRRLDITGGMTSALGITENFMRYGYDFSVVDEQGRMFRGTGERNEDWYGFGSPILATGDGVVATEGDGIADNTTTKRQELNREAVMKNPHTLFGNYVFIDHGNGEVSFFAHLKNGSVRVKAGDRVKRGQQIGEMGFSGDAITVHLHYHLQRDTKFGEGVPTQFRELKRFDGKKWVALTSGVIDSGDVVMR